MRTILAVLLVLIGTPTLANSNNEMMKACLEVHGYDKTLSVEERIDSFDWVSASSCISNQRGLANAAYRKKVTEFLAKNPHYRYPGMGLPNGVVGQLDPCWGKNRKYHKEGGC